MSHKTEIESLVYLLDDPDPKVHRAVRERLYTLGEQIVPLLDQQKEKAEEEEDRSRIAEVIHTITYGSVEEDFLNVLEGGMPNLKQLEEAVLLLCRFENPTMRVLDYKRQLDQFADTIYAEIRYEPDENKQMHLLLDYIFNDLGFSGATINYYHPDNAYLNKVIDRRRGLPISLAFIVLFLARRLELPFKGINMPIHFMLMFKGKKEGIFIDPFDHGKTVSYNQCHYFLKQNGIEPKSFHFSQVSPPEMLARCMRNLISSYKKTGDKAKMEQLQELLYTLEMLSA